MVKSEHQSVPTIPLASNAPKAFEMMFPQYRIDIRDPSSDFVYHLLSKKSAPGKNAASTKPKKKRVRSALTKLEFDVSQGRA